MNSDYKVGDLIYDANIYDAMNTNLDDLYFYKRWLPENKDARILELCCGTGRLTLPIAKEGYDITGVDYTPSMLAQAKNKAAEAGLEISFIEADIRTLNLREKYDLIFIPFNSIHHLYKVFNIVKSHLKDNGLFLFDCFNPNIQYIVEGEKEQKEIAAYTTGDGREVLIKQTMRYENKTQINRIEWYYFINGEFDSIFIFFISMVDLKKRHLMIIRQNRYLFANASSDIEALLSLVSIFSLLCRNLVSFRKSA